MNTMNIMQNTIVVVKVEGKEGLWEKKKVAVEYKLVRHIYV